MNSLRQLALVALITLAAAAFARAAAPPPRRTPLETIDLPDAPVEGVFMDYLAYDRAHQRVWVPAGNTGRVDVIDAKSHAVAQIGGFATAQVARHGHTRTVGPSSATVGQGVVYIGNRGDSSVCAVDALSLHQGACVKLDSMPDGVAYVGSRKEVWVTTPRDHSVVVLDASQPGVLRMTAKLALEGQPEGYAVDDVRGLFYTNLEDRDRTLAVDLQTHKIRTSWSSHCGHGGPKGLALDTGHNFLVVACPDHVQVLDAGQGGKLLSRLATGPGVDNLDYVPARHELYVAAARAATLTVAELGRGGQLVPRAEIPTVPGARNAVATDDGVAYLTDSKAGKILVVPTRR